MSFIKNTNYMVRDSVLDKGYKVIDSGCHYELSYKYIYRSYEGSISRSVDLATTPIQISYGLGTKRKCVILYYMPANYDAYIKSCEVWLKIDYVGAGATVNKIYFGKWVRIGEIDHKNEGIFVDYGEISASAESINEIPDSKEFVYNYESGLAWSHMNRPDWIGRDSFVEYQGGDGSQVTGLESIYGNLIIFKDNSIHRSAVQGTIPPISRTDEITQEYGCIAPDTLINVDNTLYFLSWKGFCTFNNNKVTLIDTQFSEELQYILNSVPDKYVRNATAGYNPTYNEIYLSFPFNDDPIGSYDEEHEDAYYSNSANRKTLGNIFVISLGKGYVTKFSMPTSIHYPLSFDAITTTGGSFQLSGKSKNPLQMIRKYFVNSLGELRSGDIRPYKHPYTSNSNTTEYYETAHIYIETPVDKVEADYDDVACYKHAEIVSNYFNPQTPFDITGNGQQRRILFNTANLSDPTSSENILLGRANYDDGFISRTIKKIPMSLKVPISVVFKSKYFTGDAETLIKRIRRVTLNLFSLGKSKVRLWSMPMEYADDRYLETSSILYQKEYNPTRSNRDVSTGIRLDATNSSVITITPSTDSNFNDSGLDLEYDVDSGTDTIYVNPFLPTGTNGVALTSVDSEHNKPIRFSVEIRAKGRTVINQISIFWRAIHKNLFS